MHACMACLHACKKETDEPMTEQTEAEYFPLPVTTTELVILIKVMSTSDVVHKQEEAEEARVLLERLEVFQRYLSAHEAASQSHLLGFERAR